jgi:DUF4097 and DUF4098 domain-containing protein YvlB
MKNLIKVLYIFLLLGIILVVAGVAAGARFEDIKEAFTEPQNYEFYEQTVEDTFTKIDVDSVSKNVIISKSSAVEKLQFEYYLHEKESVNYFVEDNVLHIVHDVENQVFRFSFFNFPKALYVTIKIIVPMNFDGDLNIKTTSGNITIEGDFKYASLSATSGNITLNGKFEDVDLKVTSGNVKVLNSEIEKNLEIETLSGNINLTETTISGELYADVTSGNMTINNVEAFKYRAKATSGNITINLPKEDVEYQFKLRVTSGSIRVNDYKTKSSHQAGSGTLVDIYTTSGNIRITTN